jgi:hypothetical protein
MVQTLPWMIHFTIFTLQRSKQTSRRQRNRRRSSCLFTGAMVPARRFMRTFYFLALGKVVILYQPPTVIIHLMAHVSRLLLGEFQTRWSQQHSSALKSTFAFVCLQTTMLFRLGRIFKGYSIIITLNMTADARMFIAFSYILKFKRSLRTNINSHIAPSTTARSGSRAP